MATPSIFGDPTPLIVTHEYYVQMLRRELLKQGADPNDSFLLHTILRKRFKRERKRRKLLLAALTYSDVEVNLRDEKGMTALHCAVEVSIKEMTFINEM